MINDTTYSLGVAYEVIDGCRIPRSICDWVLHICPIHPISIFIQWAVMVRIQEKQRRTGVETLHITRYQMPNPKPSEPWLGQDNHPNKKRV